MRARRSRLSRIELRIRSVMAAAIRQNQTAFAHPTRGQRLKNRAPRRQRLNPPLRTKPLPIAARKGATGEV
jgi:hypothetical protein